MNTSIQQQQLDALTLQQEQGAKGLQDQIDSLQAEIHAMTDTSFSSGDLDCDGKGWPTEDGEDYMHGFDLEDQFNGLLS